MNKLLDLFLTFARHRRPDLWRRLRHAPDAPEGSRGKARLGFGGGADGLLRHRTVYTGHHCGEYGHLCRSEDRWYRRSIIATGVVFPSLIIITIIAAFIQNFSDLAIVQNAFAGHPRLRLRPDLQCSGKALEKIRH